MNECIVHMRQDAFLPVKGVGLILMCQVSRVHLCEKYGMTAFTWVSFQSGMSCVRCLYSIIVEVSSVPLEF